MKFMRKRHLFYIPFLLLPFFILSSCENQLEEQNNSRYDDHPEQYPESETGSSVR